MSRGRKLETYYLRLVDKQPCLPNIIEIPSWSLTKCMGDENKFLFFQCVQSCSLVHIFFQYSFKKLWKNFVNGIHKVRIKAEKHKHAFDKKAVGKVIVATSWREFVDLRSSCWYYVSTWFAFQISDTFFLMVYLWHQRIQSHLIPYWIFIIAWKLQFNGPSNKN